MRNARRREPATARTVALRLLARRDYSRLELAERLRARGIAAGEVEPLHDDIERLGYLSDARYAHALVSQWAGRLGVRAIARDLRDKGIAADAAKDALATLEGRDELHDAIALWTRRFGTAPVDEREKARQVRYLIARGYSVAVALKAIRGDIAEAEPES
jgi:regulatory protein